MYLVTFGTIAVHAGSASEQLSAGPSKAVALIAYLAAAYRQQATRAELVDLLWSDLPNARGRAALRQCLVYVRTRLALQLVTAGEQVALPVGVDSDRAAFLTALDQHDPAHAVALYEGDFFPDFDASGAAGFAQWADGERQRLRDLYIGAAALVIHDRLESGQSREAVAIARRARDLVPSSQASWRLVTESLLAHDDDIGARVEFGALLTRWADDDLPLDEETERLRRRLQRTGADPARRAPRAVGLSTILRGEVVGRAAELKRLLTDHADATTGAVKRVHVSAPAGHGKSRLLDAFAALILAQRGKRPRVIRLAAIPVERDVPYAFLGHLVAELVPLRGATAVSPGVASTLVAITPVAASYFAAAADVTVGAESRRRRATALSELLAVLVDESPMVLLLDDMQWIDTASAEAMNAALDRMKRGPLQVVSAARTADTLLPADQQLVLPPLRADDIVQWLSSIARLPEAPWTTPLAALLAATSRGAPLELRLRIEYAMESGALRVDGGVWHCERAEELFARLSDSLALQHRLTALPARARDVLIQLAILGTEIPLAGLEHMMARDVRVDADLLEARALVTRERDQVAVAHQVIAQVAIEGASHDEQRAAHGNAARWLTSAPRAARVALVRAARHARQAGDDPESGRIFARLVTQASAQGDRSKIHALSAEVLGVESTASEQRALVARLPRSLRQSVYGGRTLLLLVAATALIVGFLRRETPPSRASEIRLFFTTVAATTDRSRRFIHGALSLMTADTTPLDVMEIPDIADSPWPLQTSTSRFPDGATLVSVLSTRAQRDGMDVMRRGVNGELRPFASGVYDQAMPSISPDGRYVVYIDRQFSEGKQAELVLRTSDGRRVQRLTFSDEHEGGMVWAPTGDSIAYYRTPERRVSSDLCWRAVNDVGVRCLQLSTRFAITGVRAWRPDGRLVVLTELRASGRMALILVDRSTGRETVLDSLASQYNVDPSGAVGMCDCVVPGVDGPALAVFLIDAPARKRLLRLNGDRLLQMQTFPVSWSTQAESIARIAVIGPDSVSAGSRVQLQLRAQTASGAVHWVFERAWRSLDTLVATVDRQGLVHTSSVGTARIVAHAEGQFSDTLTLTVTPAETRVAFQEDWRGDLKHWLPFGDPRPTQALHPAPHLSLNGDQTMSSGVVSAQSFDATGGLGVRVPFRLRITRPRWQRLTIGLDHVADDSTLRTWYKENREFESPATLRQTRYCTLSLPRGEGGPFRGLAAIRAGAEAMVTEQVPPEFGDGEWHDAEIQILRDGRCAVSLDGTLLGMSRSPIDVDKPLRVVMYGAAVDTRASIGAVELWRGERAERPAGDVTRRAKSLR